MSYLYPQYTQFGDHHAQLTWDETHEGEITFDDVVANCPTNVIPIRIVYTGCANEPRNLLPRPYVRFEIRVTDQAVPSTSCPYVRVDIRVTDQDVTSTS